ncbi:MAG: AsmA family protein [Alphaproteobacteria bacterium]|nr:AsmA family protein [Alphaproteobacteria bacterium]
MKKWIILAVVILVPVAGGTLVLPSMIDAEAVKKQAIDAIRHTTGIELKAIGPASVSLFPQPTVVLADVRLRNPRGFSDVDMMAVPQVTVALGWDALFAASPSPGRIALERPVLVLETLSNGQRNWDALKETVATAGQAAGGAGGTPFSGSIAVDGGEVQVKNAAGGASYEWKNLNLEAAPGEVVDVEASWQWNGEKAALSARIPARQKHGAVPAALTLAVAGGRIAFDGQAGAGEFVPAGSQGSISVSMDDLARFVAFMKGKTYAAASPVAVKAEGKWKMEQSSVLLHDLTITAPGTSIAVAARAGWGANGVVTSQLSVKGSAMDADAVLQALAGIPDEAQKEVEATKKTAIRLTLPEGLDMALDAQCDGITLFGGKMGKLKLSANLQGGELVVNQASATLPGDSEMMVFGVVGRGIQGMKLEGRAEVKGSSLRGLFTWLGADASAFPKDVLGKYHMNGNVLLTGDEIRLSEIKAGMDATRFVGAALVTLADTPPGLNATLRFDHLDGDAYFPKGVAAAPLPPGTSPPPSTAFDWLKRMKMKLQLNLAGEKLLWRGKTFTQPSGMVDITPDELKFSKLSLTSDWLSVAGHGGVKLGGERPFVTLNLEMPEFDTAKMIGEAPKGKKAGVEYWSKETFDLSLLRQYDGAFTLTAGRFIHRDFLLGPFNAVSKLEGAKLSFSQVKARFAGGSLEAQGSLLAAALPQLVFSFSLTGADIQKTLLAFGGENDIVGLMSMNGKYAATGNDAFTMARTLEGAGSFAAGRVSVGGLDLVSLARRVVNIRTVADVVNMTRLALADGRTALQRITGNITVKGGIAETPGIVLDSDVAVGSAGGKINLYEWTIDALVKLRVKLSGGQELPPLGLLLKGGLLSPTKQLDTKELEEYIAKRSADKQLHQGPGQTQ